MPGRARQHSAVGCAKIAKPVEMPFGLWTWVGQRKQVLHGGLGAHCRNLAHTLEPSVCGGDAALCQITVTSCS